ncbi:hypothetical protein [Wolbachia endosymbiont of Litomosoides brasiliensis]|nr:hypothetical protein [Wolbachia endosymbiont of Litomosoides brasiliensis]
MTNKVQIGSFRFCVSSAMCNCSNTNQEMRIRIQENLISKSTVHRLFC